MSEHSPDEPARALSFWKLVAGVLLAFVLWTFFAVAVVWPVVQRDVERAMRDAIRKEREDVEAQQRYLRELDRKLGAIH